MGGIGGGHQSGSSEPVTWQKLMTPWQKTAMAGMAPGLTSAGIQGIQGFGLSPQERSRMKAGVAGDISDMAGGMRRGVDERAAGLGQVGGVVSGAHKNIDAARIMAYGEGLKGIEDMNQQLAQQKVANLLSFVTWNAPVAQKSESSGTNISLM